MTYQDIINLLETNPSLIILLTVLISIIAMEAIVYIRSIRYLLLGSLLSELVFIALTFYLIHMSIQSLEIAIYLLLLTGILLVLTFMVAIFIFLLMLTDILLILHRFFLMDLNSIFTWIVGIIVAVIFYIMIHYAGKRISKAVFNIDEELKRGAGRDAGKP